MGVTNQQVKSLTPIQAHEILQGKTTFQEIMKGEKVDNSKSQEKRKYYFDSPPSDLGSGGAG